MEVPAMNATCYHARATDSCGGEARPGQPTRLAHSTSRAYNERAQSIAGKAMEISHRDAARRLWMGLSNTDVAATMDWLKYEARKVYDQHVRGREEPGRNAHISTTLADGGLLTAEYDPATNKIRFRATEAKHPPVIYMILQQENQTGQFSVAVMRGKGQVYQSPWASSAKHAVNIAAGFVKKHYGGWLVKPGQSTLLLERRTSFSNKGKPYA